MPTTMNISNECINIETYSNSVIKLLTVAKNSTSGSRAAAQVLLSAYNGNEWQLDITDLCLLDPYNYECALNVIRGRAELRTEPHELIEKGDEHFSILWKQWKRYHIDNRWKKECDTCYGSGTKIDYCEETDEILDECQCTYCRGTGLIGEIN